MRVYRSNRAFIEIFLHDLDEELNAVADELPGGELFDIDVFVMMLPSFAGEQDLEGHALQQMVERELRTADEENAILFRSAPMTRNSDGAQKPLYLILLDTSRLTTMSDLCLAVGIYDLARWGVSGPPQLSFPRALARLETCLEEKWTSVADAAAWTAE
ncbi:hypothetical protein [Pseudaestuariivita sp.]|uniref:hypothetical protein n=1 Tax=Pseudaestuariivita sp. TaxID=2211669 RepID=UPI004058841C